MDEEEYVFTKLEAYLWLLGCSDYHFRKFLEAYHFQPEIVEDSFIWAYGYLMNTFGTSDFDRSHMS